ncbi:hypothetical protein Tco_1074520 [Tanacetum coccineum]
MAISFCLNGVDALRWVNRLRFLLHGTSPTTHGYPCIVVRVCKQCCNCLLTAAAQAGFRSVVSYDLRRGGIYMIKKRINTNKLEVYNWNLKSAD